MKIFLLGFLVVALTAAPSDKDKNNGREEETNKSQLDVLLAKLQRQEDHLQRLQDQVDEHQRIQTKEQELKDEDLQLQLQEQRQEMKDQRQEMKDQLQQQEQQIRELTMVKRTRRSENETEHLMELIRAEINHVAGLSQCEVGSFYAGKRGEYTTETISFGRNFTRTPKVVTSLGGFYYWSGNREFQLWVQSPTTTKFDLQYHGTAHNGFYVSWIACA